MIMKTISKVKSVQGSGTFESDFGIPENPNDETSKKVLFKYEYEMEDGTILVANHKAYSAPFPVGSEVEYEITRENEYGKQGKVGKPSDNNYQPKGSGDNLKGIKIGHAITNATAIVCAHCSITSDEHAKDEIKKYAKMIYEISEELNNEL